jgi:hypothetical protein
MEIPTRIIKMSLAGIPSDDMGRGWDTAEEWWEHGVNEDYATGEYSPSEWRQLCKHFASETRLQLREMRRWGEI